jgi:hypothetical protein
MKRTILPILLIMAFSVLQACSSYGRLAHQPAVSAEDLFQMREEYEVYFAGVSTHRPSAVLFDPKDDDRVMTVHPWWIKMEDPAMLREILEWMVADVQIEPVVWRILGSDGAFYGYLYTAWNHALLRAVDEKTLWIDDMSRSKQYPGGDFRDNAVSAGE